MTSATMPTITTTPTINAAPDHHTDSELKDGKQSIESRVQRSLEILQSLTAPNKNRSSKRQRVPTIDFNDFKERLGTFQSPSVYFAKPLEISPIICARFG
jgi:hypothetical protein